MQVVGRKCARCDKRLAWAGEGVGCLACDVIYHHSCLASRPDKDPLAGVCPECLQSFEATEREAEQVHLTAVDAQARRRSRWQTLAFLAVAIALLGGAWGLIRSSLGDGPPLTRVGTVLVACLILIGVCALFRFAYEAHRHFTER